MLKQYFVLLSLLFCVQWMFSQDNDHVERKAQWAEGRCEAVYRRGDFTFIGNGAYLQVYRDRPDKNLDFFQELLLPASIQDIWALSSLDYIYVACGNAGLQIVHMNTSNQTLSLIDEVSTYGFVSGVSHYYQHIYLAASDQGLLIVEADNVNYNYNIVGQYLPSRPVRDVWAVHDSLLLMAVDESGLFSIFTKEKDNPSVLDSLDFAPVFSGYEPAAQNIISIGRTAYVAAGSGGFRIVDFQDSSNLQQTGYWHHSQRMNIMDMRHSGNNLYLACGSDGVWGPINVSDPENVINQTLPFPPLDTEGVCNRIWVEDNTAYVCDGPNGLVIADVTAGSQISTLYTWPSSDFAFEVNTDDHYAFLAAGKAGLKIFDLNFDELTQDHLELLSEYNTPGEVRGIHIQDEFAFLADGSRGLHVVDLGDNPASPQFYEQYWNSETDTCYDVAIYNQDDSYYALLAYGGIGMMVIDINGFEYTKIHEVPTPGSSKKVVIHEDQAFLADSSGVYVYNIIDLPGLPVPTHSITYNIEALSLDVVGDSVFVANGRYGFLVWNIQNDQVDRIDTGGMITDIQVKDKMIYLTDAESGLLLYDFSEPDLFIETGHYNTQETPSGVDLDDSHGYICMADGNDGFYVLKSDIQPVFSMSPSSPIKFGPVAPGESRERILRISNEGKTLLDIKNIQCQNSLFSFSQTSFPVLPDDTHEIVIQFSPTEAYRGTIVTKAKIYTNDPAEQPFIEVTLQGDVSEIMTDGPYVPDDFTIGLYHMDDDDVTESLQDASSSEKDAQVQGSPDQVNSHSGLSQALDLDGESDYAYIPYHDLLNFYDTPFTIELWFNITEKPGQYAILMRRGDNGTRQVELALDNNTGNGLIASVWDKNGTQHQLAFGPMSALKTGQWYHTAFTWDTDMLHLYLNGASVSTASLSEELRAQNTDSLYIGANPTGGSKFTGLIDEVRISNIDRQPWEFQVNRARISVQPDTIEFGNVLYNESRTVPVTIQNLGSQSLKIEDIFSDYSSVSFHKVDIADSLKPDSSTTFWITYKPEKETDHANYHYITIENSDPTRPSYDIWLQGKSVTSFKAGRYETDPFTQGLYHFDDNFSFVASDSSGQELDGQLHGAISYDGTQKQFQEGYSLKLNTENDKISIHPDSEDMLGPASGGFTVECWFRMQPFPYTETNSVLMRRGTGTPNQFDLYIDNSGQLVGRVYNNTQDYFEVTSDNLGPIQKDLWYHAALVQRLDSLFLYVNGDEIDRSAFTGTMASEQTYTELDTLSLLVGGSWGMANPFYGHIDEIRISGIGRQSWEFNVNMARIHVSSTQLDFGKVYLGSSRVMELTVDNFQGIDDLVVDTVSIDPDSYFTADRSGFTLTEDDESKTIRITYQANDLGIHTGEMIFFTNDPYNPQLSVNLKGETIQSISQGAYTSDEFTLSLFHMDEILENEGVKTLVDSSGNGMECRLVGQIALSDTGRFGKGIRFFGGLLEMPGTVISENDVNAYFTIESWFNLSEKPDSTSILMKHDNGEEDQFEIILERGKIRKLKARVIDKDKEEYVLQGPSLDDINVNQWYHLALSIDGQWARLMIDGIVEDSVSFSEDLLNIQGGTLRFGADADTGQVFLGNMDEIRISNINRESWDLNVDPPEIVISPLTLNFYRVQLGFTRTMTVSIRNTGDQSLIVDRVEGTDAVFSIPDTLKSFMVHRLDTLVLPITFRPGIEKDYEYHLKIHSNAINLPTVNLSMYGSGYVKPGAVEYEVDNYTLGLYHFNQSEGDTIFDESANQSHGRLWNGARVEPGNGFYGAGVLFEGDNDQVEISGKDIFQNDFSHESITLECYFRTDTVSQILIGKGFKDSLMQGDIIVGIDSQGYLIVNGIGGIAPRVDDNVWHHMAFAYNSQDTVGILYLDWVKVWAKSWDISQPKADELRPIILGAAEAKIGGYSGYFQGYMDEFRFSNIDRELWDFNSPDTIDVKLLTSSPAHPKAGDPLTLGVEVPVESNLSSVMIYYRQGGMESYDMVSAYAESDTVFRASIPGESVTLRGLEYYIQMVSQTQEIDTYPIVDPAHSPLFMSIRFETMTTQILYSAQKNRSGKYQLAAMFSIPFDLVDKKPVDTVFVDVPIADYDPFQWRLFWWDPKNSQERYEKTQVNPNGTDYLEYAEKDKDGKINGDVRDMFSMPQGRAYWIVSYTERNFELRSGQTVSTAKGYKIDLEHGWNMIGNPYNFDIKLSDCTLSSSQVQGPYGWGEDGWDPNISVLEPWKGYFINNPGADTEYFYIQPRDASLSKSDRYKFALLQNLEENAWLIQLSVSGEYGRDMYNYAGMRPNAGLESDPYDRPEPPPAFYYGPTLYFDHPEWENQPGKYLADIRGKNSNGHVWDMDIDCPVKKNEYQISWQFYQSLPEDWEAFLLDLEEETAVDLQSKTLHTFQTNTDNIRRSFKVIAGDEAFLQEHREGISLEPVEFQLYPNAPNPFNPSTTIHFSLPKKSDAEIIIYNALGQQVKRMIKHDCSAGHHAVIWDGTNNRCMKLASGIYIYKLKASEKVAVRKMILLK